MYLKNIKMWTALISVLMPISVYAGQIAGKFGVDELLEDWVVIVLLAIFSLAGGIGSVFIKTDADEFITSPRFLKIFIGFWLGLSVGLAIYNYYGVSVYMLLTIVLVASSLGAAILVFYMRWFADPNTGRKFKEKIERTLDLERDKDAS